MSEIPRRHHGCCTDHARSWLAPGLAWCTELRHWRNVRAAQSQQPAGSYPPWAGIHAKGGAAPNSEAPLPAAAFAWCVSSRRWCIRERGTSARRMAHGAATNPAMFVLHRAGHCCMHGCIKIPQQARSDAKILVRMRNLT